MCGISDCIFISFVWIKKTQKVKKILVYISKWLKHYYYYYYDYDYDYDYYYIYIYNLIIKQNLSDAF